MCLSLRKQQCLGGVFKPESLSKLRQWTLTIRCRSITWLTQRLCTHSWFYLLELQGVFVSILSEYEGLSVIWCLLQFTSPWASVLPDSTLTTEQSLTPISELSGLICTQAHQLLEKKKNRFFSLLRTLSALDFTFLLCLLFPWWKMKWWKLQ